MSHNETAAPAGRNERMTSLVSCLTPIDTGCPAVRIQGERRSGHSGHGLCATGSMSLYDREEPSGGALT
jgi:hypothetical protein